MKWNIDLQKGLSSVDGKHAILFKETRENIIQLLGKPDDRKRFKDEEAWYKGTKIDPNLSIRMQFDKNQTLKSIELFNITLFDKNKEQDVDFEIEDIDLVFSQVTTKEAWKDLITSLKKNNIILKKDLKNHPESYTNKDGTFVLGYNDDGYFNYIFIARPLETQKIDHCVLTPHKGILLAGDGLELSFGMTREQTRSLLGYNEKYSKGENKNIDYYNRVFEDSKWKYYEILLFFNKDILSKIEIFRVLDLYVSDKILKKNLTTDGIIKVLEKEGFSFEEYSIKEDIKYIDKTNLTALGTARIDKNMCTRISIAVDIKTLQQDMETMIPETNWSTGEIIGWS